VSGRLLSEFLDAAEHVTPAVAKAMASLGVAFIIDGLPRYGITRIECNGELYEPSIDGGPALIVAELCGGTDYGKVAVEDLIAFLPNQPSKWFLRHGSIDVLGETAIVKAQGLKTALTVYRTPLAWLQAASQGACLLNWRADPRYVFRGIADLKCEDETLARRLTARIAECSLPVPRVSSVRRIGRAA